MMTAVEEETTRDSVLRTATDLFAEHGYHAVGMRWIADAVGLRTASLYHHFPSKAALLSEIAYAATSEFITDALADLDGPGTAAHRLGTVLRNHIIYFHQHRREEAITRRDMASLPADVLAQIQQTRRAYHTAITNTIADGCASGEFAVTSPDLAAFAILDAINGINLWFRPTGTFDLDALSDAYLKMMLEGILSAVRGPPETP